MAFIVWFVVSALVVRLPAIGFKLTTSQLFWLAAMPGLAGRHAAHLPYLPGAALRHAPCGRRCRPLSLLVPAIGWAYAVQESRHALLAVDGARASRRPRRRQLLLVHAVDQPVLPEAEQGHRARHPGRHRQFRRQRGAVRHPLGDRLRASFGSLVGDPQTFTRPTARPPDFGCRTRPRSTCRSSSCSASLAWFDAEERAGDAPISASSSTSSSEKHGFYMTLLYITTFGTFSGYVRHASRC